MSQKTTTAAEIFSVGEIARVAGASPAAVRELIARRGIRSAQGYIAAPHAVRCVRDLRRQLLGIDGKDLFAPVPQAHRSPMTGAVSSAAAHAGIAAVVLLLTSMGATSQTPAAAREAVTRLVFLATPGPGGGGGGGGLKQPTPPPKAQMKTASALRSPVPPPRRLTSRPPEPKVERPVPPAVTTQPARVDEPPPPPVLTPQVIAPVASASADARDRAGVLNETARETESQGTGSGGGVGSGQGTGIGEGTGSGIGPGSGGGTGGGPYRPGSGITAPDLLREVRPNYTDEARRLGIEGEVVLEIIVRADGTVGEARVVQGLRRDLDRQAMDAVRQWRFSPARRYGQPVDVVVEVAVEFKLR